MSYFNAYRARLLTNGDSTSEVFSNDSKEFVNQSFTDSTTYKRIIVGSNEFDVRMVDSDKEDEKTLLFRPDTVVSVGQYATIDNNVWLLINFDSDYITPKSKIKKANRKLRWRNQLGNILEQSCVLESLLYEEMRDGKYFYTPKGNLRIYVQFNSTTKELQENQRFIFGSSVYKIGGIDDFTHVSNDEGFLILNLEKTESIPNDDFVYMIADNSHFNSDTNALPSGGGWL